jgi:hypothetical protein
MVNKVSIIGSAIAFPRRMNHKCCVKHIAVLAARAVLKIVVKRIDAAET